MLLLNYKGGRITKLKEINKDFLNLHYKGKRLAYWEKDDFIYITDSYRLYKLNKSDLKLNYDIFSKADLSKFIDDSKFVDAVITDELVIYNGTTCRVIKNDNLKIEINNDYLKYFENPSVKVYSNSAPVYLYENNELVGLVMPIVKY